MDTSVLHEQKKNETKRKFAGCIFLPTPALLYAKQKELASLKQLFVFNAPKSTSASRQKKEAGIFRSGCILNIASLVVVYVSPLRRGRKAISQGNNIFVDTKVLSPPYEGGQGDVP